MEETQGKNQKRKDIRNAMISIRLTPDEKQYIQDKADEHGVSLTNFILESVRSFDLIAEMQKTREDIDGLRRELKIMKGEAASG